MVARFLKLACVLLLIMLSVAPARAAERLADIQLQIWPSPSIVVRGDTVLLDVMISNQGEVKASRTRVTLPFAKGELSFVKIDIPDKTTWVMELAEDRIMLMFGTLQPGDKRTAKIYFTVGKELPDGFQIKLRASSRWDNDEGVRVRSNEALLTVAGAVNTPPRVTIEPAAGPVGTVFIFRVEHYFPQEKVFTWLNTPDGVLETKLFTSATEQGNAVLEFQSKLLKPGKYSMVIFGDTSKLTTVVPFEVQ